MKLYIQTRTVDQDYRWFPKPAEIQPRDEFFKRLDTTRPGLVLQHDGDHWCLFISGLSTSRVDRVRTPIRTNLLITGDHDSFEEHQQKLMSLLWDWMTVAAGSPSEETLASKLGNHFTEAAVDAVFQGDETPLLSVEAMLKLLGHASYVPDVETPKLPKQSIGGIRAPKNMGAAIHWVESRNSEGPFVFAHLNGIGPDENKGLVEELSLGDTPTLLLVDSSNRYRELEKKDQRAPGKFPEAPSPTEDKTTRPEHRRTIVIVGTVAIVIILGMLAFVRCFPSAEAELRPAETIQRNQDPSK